MVNHTELEVGISKQQYLDYLLSSSPSSNLSTMQLSLSTTQMFHCPLQLKCVRLALQFSNCLIECWLNSSRKVWVSNYSPQRALKAEVGASKFFSEDDLASNNCTLSKNHGLLDPNILQGIRSKGHIHVHV